ncbi:MAG: hypothetical protein J7603_08770 [Pseudacidovorax sp.]|nr:hypothetical protein [Pseudacidovorax sp.]
MDLDSALSVLKFAAVLMAGVWGVVGLLVDYKDENKQITKWGRRALVGTIVSTLVAVASQAVETSKQREADRKERAAAADHEKEVNNTLLQIQRAMYPVKDIEVDASADMRMAAPQVSAYMARIARQRKALVAAQGGFERNSEISLPENLWPDSAREKVADRVLTDFGLEIGFFRRSSPGFQPPKDLYRTADLYVTTTPTSRKAHSLSLKEDPSIISISAWNIPASSKQVVFNSGTIASVYDLYGATAVVDFRYDDWDDILEGVAGIQENSTLRIHRIRIGAAQIYMNDCRSLADHRLLCSLSQSRDFRGIDLPKVKPTAR